MSTLTESTDNSGQQLPVTIPNVTGMTLLDAALGYADKGIFLLLVKTGKHPGSHVGKGWPAKSTCNPDTITAWCEANAEAGIAIHTGRSSLVACDLDVDVIPNELLWLKRGLFQSTRGGRGARGHYVFASSETFTSGKMKLADGTVVGEVRSGNAVIMTQPSPHLKADEGGEYHWVTTGPVPTLPDDARAYLTTKAGVGSVERLPVRSSAELDAWYAAHTEQRQPWRRQIFRDRYAQNRTSGDKHHDAMMKVLGWAGREIEAGFVSATVFDDLYDDWFPSFSADDRDPPPGEFEAMVVRAIEDLAEENPDDLRNRGNRDFGTDHRDYRGVFDGFEFHPQGGTTDDDEFWTSRAVLADLRQFARARRVAPWAMLGHVLARAVTAIPPDVVLPPLVGSHASLNLFVALVGPSGAGKGGAAGAAADWLATDPATYTAPLGSGEGVAKVFAYKSKSPGTTTWTQTGLRAAVFFDAPEVDNLAALNSRNSSTLLPQLRSAYSGEELGFSYADPAKAVRLCAHRYRLCLTVGVQPGRGRALLDDADGGTPQRFVWLPTNDADAPDDPPTMPARFNLARWPDPPPVGRIVSPAGPETLLDTPASRAALRVIEIPDAARVAIDAHRVSMLRGGSPVDPLDGHRLLCRVKVAAALMALDRRTDRVTDDDWDLSGVVMEVSDRTRRSVVEVLVANAESENVSRGRSEGVRADAAEQVKTDKAVQRVSENIVRKLMNSGGEMARAALRKTLRSDDRTFFDYAEVLLVESGRIEKCESDNAGPSGYVLRLADRSAS